MDVGDTLILSLSFFIIHSIHRTLADLMTVVPVLRLSIVSLRGTVSLLLRPLVAHVLIAVSTRLRNVKDHRLRRACGTKGRRRSLE